MSDINKEIEDMASKLAKASTDPREKLFTIIKSLGPAGLKERMAILSDDDKAVLKAALEEMNLQKAVSFDKEADGAKMIRGRVMDSLIQEEIASDDADEKLVKPEAAITHHQGVPTDGWQGQVIKSVNESEELTEQVVKALLDRGMSEADVVAKCMKKGMDDKKVQGAVNKFKKPKDIEDGKEEMEKAAKMSKDEAAKKILAMEEKEHGTKNPKKLVEDEKKEDEAKGMKMNKSTGTMKVAAEKEEDAQKDQDEDAQNGQAAAKKQAKMEEKESKVKKSEELKEEENPEAKTQLGDAPKMDGATMGKKEAAPDVTNVAQASKQAQADVNNMKVTMKKSTVWDDDSRLLKANTQGRNFTFNVEQFINDNQTEPTAETVQKSAAKEDINDLIAKSGDQSWQQLQHERMMAENAKKVNGSLVKSFDVSTDLAAILGLTEEEAKKILG